MSVLVIGDSHGYLPMVREACRLAARLGASSVLSVGDFGVWPGTSGQRFLDRVDRRARELDVLVRLVPGNHDDYDALGRAALDEDGWMGLRPRVRAAPRGHIEARRVS